MRFLAVNVGGVGITCVFDFVVNAHAPYRDFSVNGVLQDHNNITNITLQVGDDLSVVARAVGNVSVITADHDGSKFTCVTGFACNKHTHDVSNRYLNCFLSSPAQLSDSGKTLTISVNNMELKRFVITGGYILMYWCTGGAGIHEA